MSFSKLYLKPLALVFSLIISGCSFGILYTPYVEEQFTKVFVSTIADREGQILRNNLRFLFEGHGEQPQPQYNLNIKLKITEKALGVSRKGVATRKNKTVKAQITLVDRATHRVLHRGSVKAENSYVVRQTLFYSNPVTEEHATTQAIELVAQFIKADLAVYFTKNED